MKAIIAHPNLDFDALASMVAAQKLYSGAILVSVGKLRNNVKDFIAMHGDFIEIKNYINKAEIEALIMVDTRSKKRLLDFSKVLDNKGVTVEVFDHHSDATEDVANAMIHYEALGANVTQLVERIRAQEIPISAQEATLFALGIYDDTGSMRYSSTTVRDVQAVAWLLENGANLEVIREYSEDSLTEEQEKLFGILLHQNKIRTIHHRDILISTADTDHFIVDLSVLTMKLKDTFSVDAAFTVVRMENRIYLVGRSSVKEINIHDTLAPYGGRGHFMASSAMLKDMSRTVQELADEIFSSLEEMIKPSLKVRDVMSSPVKTIDANVTVNVVGEYLVRYGHSGYPVMDGDKLLGIISHRDVEKCKYHGLGNVPVKGYMSHYVKTVSPEQSVDEARALMVNENIGRLPVVEDGALVGIVTRTDILELIYGEKIDRGHHLTYTANAEGKVCVNLIRKLREMLPDRLYSILKDLSQLADREALNVYLVGGLVRDLIMGERSTDLDVVVEGDGIAFAEKVGVALDGEVSTYPKFGTATVNIAGVVKIDIAGARTEFYEYPAARPLVEQSSLKQDLFRRDFTVNAMALSLNYETIGLLVDFYNGREDIHDKKIRVLHNLSFVEDPTRIIRALRFCARYGFKMTEETEGFARKAIADGALKNLSRRRIWHEVDLALREKCAYEIIAAMADYGIWEYLFPGYTLNRSLKKDFAVIPENIEFLGNLKRKPNLSLVRFLLITFSMGKKDLEEFFTEVQMPRLYRDAVFALKEAFYRYDINDENLSDIEWYTIMLETEVEVVIAAYMKSKTPWKERLIKAYLFYKKNPILCPKSEVRQLEGYERGQMNMILGDLLAEKKRGGAKTKAEELAYMKENLKKGKYKGDVNV